MFPPAEIESLGMEKVLRIYPHSQNTGGFFVAVLEKTAAIGRIDNANSRLARLRTAQSSDAVDQTERADAIDQHNDVIDQDDDVNDSQDIEQEVEKPGKVEQDKKDGEKPVEFSGRKESPFIFLDEDNSTLAKCRRDYGLDPNFAKGLFVVRSETKTDDFTLIYLVSEKAKPVLSNERLKVINSGVKIFKKSSGDSDVPYRICSEGVSTIAPYLSQKRHLNVDMDVLRILIQNGYPKFESFSEEIKTKFEKMDYGSGMLSFDPKQIPGCKMKHLISLPFFRAKTSVSLLLNKAERKSLLYRLVGETVDDIKGLDKDIQ